MSIPTRADEFSVKVLTEQICCAVTMMVRGACGASLLDRRHDPI
jgi:hypothetical protein